MNDNETPSTPFKYHLELTPAQLKITHAALHSFLDDFGHHESDVRKVIREVLSRLPDDHAIRAIQLDSEIERELESRGEDPAKPGGSKEAGPTPGARLQAVPDEDEEPGPGEGEDEGSDDPDDGGGGPSAA